MKHSSITRRFSNGWRSLFQSVSLRLFLWLFGVIIVTFATYAFFSVRWTSAQWERTVYGGAERFSDLIQRSTHYAMLLNRKEDVHQIIRTIAREPGVEGVRIYNKEGQIIFSADAEEMGRQVDLHAEACVSCHAKEEPLSAVPAGQRFRIFEPHGDGRVLGLIDPIENSRECYQAPCHAHSPEQSVLGVLDVRMSMADADAQLVSARRQAVIAAVLIALLSGLASAAFIHQVVRRPVKHLTAGVERVAGGDLDTEFDEHNRDEIGQLATAFNAMTRDLKQARGELQAWSERLESALKERTAELGRTQREVAHMEKMASLGKLAATVAHELNNPLAGILNYSKLVERTLRESESEIVERDELRRYLELIQREASRSGEIVRNLLVFARRSGAELSHHRLNAILERSVMLLRHHLELSSIHMQREELEGDDGLICDADQIQQALVALMVNAVEAMPQGGTLRLAASGDAGHVRIAVSDTGIGIPEEDLPHIFEPFFSSKDDAEGAGLGLAVVYGIVQRHGGRIEVESTPQQGTTFRIELPRRRRPDGAESLEPALIDLPGKP